jgi:hypothetical protein
VAIRLVLEVNHPHGKPDITRPVVLCDDDECGREIERGKDGMYLFDGRRENEAYWRSEPVEIYTVHKNWVDGEHMGCWSRFVERMGWDRVSVTDTELSNLPVYLANVLGGPRDGTDL